MVKMKKRKKRIRREKEEERDMLSELPDCVLLHILEFMETRYAVQTCVLSKRWKDLWKGLTSLSLWRMYFRTIANYNKFVSRVLSGRDSSTSLLNLDFGAYGSTAPKLLNKVTKYAMLHNVPQMTIHIGLYSRYMSDFSIPYIFSCLSLTFLKLSMSSVGHILELPKSLQLPALRSLHLKNASFTANDNDCAEPFSTCNLLSTLVIDGCSLHHDAKFLCISNLNLSSLNLENTFKEKAYKLVLSTPNLTSLTIVKYFSYHQLSSTCNLSFLEEVNIHTFPCISYSVIVGSLQVFANVKILTFSSDTLKIILNDLSNLATMRIQPPCFVRLESLKIKMNPYQKISDEEVNRIVEYLLQKSPLTRVAVTNC